MADKLEDVTASFDQAATILGLSRSKLLRFIREGIVKVRLEDGVYRVPMASISALLAGKTGHKTAEQLWEDIKKTAQRNGLVPEEEVQADVQEAIEAVRRHARS